MISISPEGGGFQQQVLRRFTALWLLRQHWEGCLVLSCSLANDGPALALAAHIAGAVCLSIEPNIEVLKAASRSGACDFAVNTLDEALRTMKNEIRKGRALSVGLHGIPALVLREIVERGLLPVIAVVPSPFPIPSARGAVAQLQAIGVQIVDFDGTQSFDHAINTEALLDQKIGLHNWSLRCFDAPDRAGITMLDAALLKLVKPEDTLRSHWLQCSSQHFSRGRPLNRALWLSDAEVSILHDFHQIVP